jgi:D-aminoacyl-tRNA deacylase
VRVVLQRVRWARVAVGDEVAGEIGPGLLALVGVAAGDGEEEAALLARKTVRLRVLAGEERPFDRSLLDVPGAALLCVSQFTLLGDVRRGNRPSWSAAAPPEVAEALVEAYAAAAAAEGVPVARGRFGAAMAVSLENDGPVTLVLDSDGLRAPRSSAG